LVVSLKLFKKIMVSDLRCYIFVWLTIKLFIFEHINSVHKWGFIRINNNQHIDILGGQ